jgi:hypothetical protein
MTVDTVDFSNAEVQRAVDEAEGDLGDVASSGLDDEGPGQPALVEGPEPGKKIRFVGMSFEDAVDADYNLGQVVEFTVKGRIVGNAVKLMADGHQRDEVTVDVQSVEPVSR